MLSGGDSRRHEFSSNPNAAGPMGVARAGHAQTLQAAVAIVILATAYGVGPYRRGSVGVCRL